MEIIRLSKGAGFAYSSVVPAALSSHGYEKSYVDFSASFHTPLVREMLSYENFKCSSFLFSATLALAPGVRQARKELGLLLSGSSLLLRDSPVIPCLFVRLFEPSGQRLSCSLLVAEDLPWRGMLPCVPVAMRI